MSGAMESTEKMKDTTLSSSGKANDAFVMEIDSAKDQSGVIDATITTVQENNFMPQSDGIKTRKQPDSIEMDNVSQEYDISYNFNQYSVIRWIVQSQFVQALQRIYPLVIILLYGFDIALDIHQTSTYYRISQNDRNISITTENSTSEDKTLVANTISPSEYLYGSIAAWICVPLLWSLLLLIFTQRPLPVINRIMKFCFDYEYNFTSGMGIKILLGILALPIDTVFSILWIYILVPYVSFKRALQCAILGKEFHKDDNIDFDLPIVGIRALPHLILGTVFAYNESMFLSSFDLYFGIPVPMTIISAALSAICLLVGIITGFIKLREHWLKDTPSDLKKIGKNVSKGTKRHVTKVKEFMEETPQVKFKDKFSFTLGILTICLSQWLAMKNPNIYVYFWVPLTIVLWIYRFVDYSSQKFELFMLDFCYFINISVAVQVIFYPNHLEWFQANYVLTMGPIYFAIIVWRNSLVFHDLDKLTSFFLHAFPPLIMHMVRWNMITTQLPIKQEGDVLSLMGNFVWPLAFYGIWQVAYLIIISIPLHWYLKDKDVVTSYRYMMTGKKKQGIYKLTERLFYRMKIMKTGEQLDPDTVLGKSVFVFIQLIYTILVIAPVQLFYSYYWVSFAYLVIVFSVACWNGASYYIEIFSTRYNLKFENKRNSSKEKN